MSDQDQAEQLAQQVAEAAEAGTAVRIRGAGTRGFLGRPVDGQTLDVSGHRGIVNYEPTELVMTARAGTPLDELEATLTEQGQMMPFEPPRFGPGATLGGAIATGLSGPRRPWAGAARDLVLGTRLINGRGEHIRFGGEVMKNVAGYDLSRPMAGSFGTLGILLDVSLKLLPRPAAEATRALEVPMTETYRRVASLQAEGAPISGAAHDGNRLYLRVSGAESAVRQAEARLGGEPLSDPARFWLDLKEHDAPFFTEGENPLWRVALPPAAELPELSGAYWLDWGGQQLWVRTALADATVRERVAALGGHATRFRGGDRTGEVFHPLEPGVAALHGRLKTALDPEHRFNPGRLDPEG